jgi:regulator of cell morphogenesis and NO signaling
MTSSNGLDVGKPVGELVVQRPARARVFEELGIDYCCGGKRPLREVCEEKGLDVARVADRLERAEASAADEVDWNNRSMSELADHIERTHHVYLKAELPRLGALVAKVAGRHGSNHPELPLLGRVFEGVRAELEAHMTKEEQILFPAIRRLEADPGEAAFSGDSLAGPIRVMEHEHDSAGEALARMRELTDDFAVPADACNSYRAMLHDLQRFEEDMHVHIHKENNILFPRAQQAGRVSTLK